MMGFVDRFKRGININLNLGNNDEPPRNDDWRWRRWRRWRDRGGRDDNNDRGDDRGQGWRR